MKVEDPLGAFLRVRQTLVGGARPFEGGEHLWVGNAGAAEAARRVGSGAFGPFERRAAPEPLTYGEIVAFSGDFYETPEDLFDEKPSPLPWLREGNDLSDLIELLGHELAWIELPPGSRGTNYPDENIALWWNAKQYVELARRNTVHFGWHNALAYVGHHRAALALAARARAATDRGERSLLWRQAVYTNGFADHFLTDGFAAGHVRVPAGPIRRWATAEGVSEAVAGLLVKLIHDQDGHVRARHGAADAHGEGEGLRVVNARGEVWSTRCDGQLFLTGTEGPAVRQVVEAVAVSVEELLRVYAGAPVPEEGPFSATELVPWAHPDERPLEEKFPAHIDRGTARGLLENLPAYLRLPLVGIRPAHVEACFAVLPRLMGEFREEVARDVREDERAGRLAPAYVEGYAGVR